MLRLFFFGVTQNGFVVLFLYYRHPKNASCSHKYHYAYKRNSLARLLLLHRYK